jgi:hypothetical protein
MVLATRPTIRTETSIWWTKNRCGAVPPVSVGGSERGKWRGIAHAFGSQGNDRDNSSNVVRPRKAWQAWLVLAVVGLPSIGSAVVSGLFNANYAAHFGHTDQERLTWMAASVLITCFVTGPPLAIEILRACVPHLAVAARALWVASMAFTPRHI